MIGDCQKIQPFPFGHLRQGLDIMLPVRGIGVQVQIPKQPGWPFRFKGDLVPHRDALGPHMVRPHQNVPGSGHHRLHQISRGGAKFSHGDAGAAAPRPAQKLPLSILQPQIDDALPCGIAVSDGEGAHPLGDGEGQ